MADVAGSAPDAPLVPRRLARLAAYSWSLIVIGIVVVAALWLLSRLRVVVTPIVVALMLSRILAPVAHWLRAHRWRPGLAAVASMGGLVLVVVALVAAVAPSVADEAGSLGPTIEEATDDIADWFVEDSPFNVDRQTVDRVREQARDWVESFFRASDDAVISGATLVAEVFTMFVLALILTFFMLRDGERFASWAYARVPARRRDPVRRAAERGWATLGGYLRGVLILGIVEAITIGLALLLAGGSLVAPVMLVTFALAFVPIVGAIIAGVVAVLVALVTGGLATAVIVAIVAIVVQQFDNDLLAPVIYGRALALHPVVILLSVTAGGALFGLAGTILAVPVVAVSVNASKEYRRSETVDPSPG